MDEINLSRRYFKDMAFRVVLLVLSLSLIIPLFCILWYIVSHGIAVINWSFLTELPRPVGVPGGGISNAIVGTCMLMSIAALFSIPLGIAAGICLTEFENAWWSDPIRIAVEVLQGTPSIVMGMLAYLWVVVPMGGFSALAGGIALGFIMLPVVIRSTEETVRLIPHTLKEASLSLGVPYYRTILKIILPTGLKGIATGTLLGLARVSGETAPLLFTAFGNPFMNTNILKSVNALPLLIFNYATSPYQEWQDIAWGGSFILISFVFLLSILSKVAVRKI